MSGGSCQLTAGADHPHCVPKPVRREPGSGDRRDRPRRRGVAIVARVGPYRACHPQLDVPVTVTTAPLVITPTEPGSGPGLSALRAEHPTDARHPIAATIVEIGATLRGRRTGGPGIPLETGEHRELDPLPEEERSTMEDWAHPAVQRELSATQRPVRQCRPRSKCQPKPMTEITAPRP